MPIVNGTVMSPDDAIAAGLCPETGIPLAGVNIADHIRRTWQSAIDPGPPGDEPRRRIKMLKDWTKAHEDLHPKYDEDTGELLTAGAPKSRKR